jgi:hypothetical protein
MKVIVQPNDNINIRLDENIIIQPDDNINVIIQPGSIVEDRRGCEFGRA